jgi:prepilin-type N-terminal cleavage/methylation domain-containing protein
MIKNSNKGFTLIELLVVIAIIGILSAAVLVNLNGARVKGKDGSAIASLSSLRTAAEMYYSNNGNSFDDFCGSTGTDGDGLKLVNAAKAQLGDDNVQCEDDITGWAASGKLSTDKYFCVDYTGNGTTTLTGAIASTTCQ